MNRVIFSIAIKENSNNNTTTTTIKQVSGSSASVVVTGSGDDLDVTASIQNIPHPPITPYDKEHRSKW